MLLNRFPITDFLHPTSSARQILHATLSNWEICDCQLDEQFLLVSARPHCTAPWDDLDRALVFCVDRLCFRFLNAIPPREEEDE